MPSLTQKSSTDALSVRTYLGVGHTREVEGYPGSLCHAGLSDLWDLWGLVGLLGPDLVDLFDLSGLSNPVVASLLGPALGSHVLAAEQAAARDCHKHLEYSFGLMEHLVDLVGLVGLEDLAAAPGPELTYNAGTAEHQKT